MSPSEELFLSAEVNFSDITKTTWVYDSSRALVLTYHLKDSSFSIVFRTKKELETFLKDMKMTGVDVDRLEYMESLNALISYAKRTGKCMARLKHTYLPCLRTQKGKTIEGWPACKTHTNKITKLHWEGFI